MRCRRPENKRKRRIGGWIALGVVLLLLGGVGAGTLYVWTTYEDRIREFMGWEEPKDYEAGIANGEAFVTISPGDTGAPISENLFAAGVTKTPDAFYDYLIDTGQNPPFVPGVFQLQKQMTSEAALAALLDPANKLENSAQLREGLTVEQSLPLLAEGTGLPARGLPGRGGGPGGVRCARRPGDRGRRRPTARGLALPRDVHVRPGSDRDGGHRHAREPAPCSRSTARAFRSKTASAS